MAEAPPAPAASARRRASQQQQQPSAEASRDQYRVRTRTKMERVVAWLAECAAAREQHQRGEDGASSNGSSRSSSSAALLLENCDGETEDLLLQVLIARPKYEGIPSVEEIQQFAGQLRAYHARLWTLGMTKGFFRNGAAVAAADELLGWRNAAEYPDDIDSLESVSMQEEEGQNWMVHGKRVFVRKISPAEEELRDEMIQEYRNIRRHTVNGHGNLQRHRQRMASVSTNLKTAAGAFGNVGKENRTQFPT